VLVDVAVQQGGRVLPGSAIKELVGRGKTGTMRVSQAERKIPVSRNRMKNVDDNESDLRIDIT
jgi:hypothetical protein